MGNELNELRGNEVPFLDLILFELGEEGTP